MNTKMELDYYCALGKRTKKNSRPWRRTSKSSSNKSRNRVRRNFKRPASKEIRKIEEEMKAKEAALEDLKRKNGKKLAELNQAHRGKVEVMKKKHELANIIARHVSAITKDGRRRQ